MNFDMSGFAKFVKENEEETRALDDEVSRLMTGGHMTSTLDRLAEDAYRLVREDGLSPTLAAEKVVAIEAVATEDLLFCVQRYVGSIVGRMLTSERRGARQRDYEAKASRIEALVSVLETSVSHAASVLLLPKQGADGVERPLCDFTVEDHRYRLEIETAIAAGGKQRGQFHELALTKMGQWKAATIAELPLADQYELARILADG